MLVVGDGEAPAWAEARGYEGREEVLEEHLAYRDERAAYAVKRFLESDHNRRNLLEEVYVDQLAALKAAVHRTLLVRRAGKLLVPAGKVRDLGDLLGDLVQDRVQRPVAREMPWSTVPTKTLRDYQEACVRLLLEKRHGSIEIAPGTGKTLIALQLVKELGLRAVVCSPSSAIVEQTYQEFLAHLGPRRVGKYGDGAKDLRKDVTVATMQALHACKQDAAEFFREKVVVVGDEAHQASADTFKEVCLDLLGNAPYRFWMSGSLIRNDGLQPLLEGIVGPVVFSMDALEAQRKGWLARTLVRMLRISNGTPCGLRDPARATREALFASKRANAVVAEVANRMAAAGRPVLIMVDELDQFARLRPLLRHEARFAHACRAKDRLKKAVPKDCWEVDVMRLVKDFNELRYPILVGTSCVGTGVDVRATGAGIFFRGGRSEVDVRQTAGRFMRLFEGKRDVVVFDVDVVDGGLVHKHALARHKVWSLISEDVQAVEVAT